MDLALHLPNSVPSAVALLLCCVVVLLSLRALGRLAAILYAAALVGSYLIIGNLTMPVAAAALSVLIGRYTAGEHAGHDRGLDFAKQVVLVLGGLAVYTTARHFIESDAPPAIDHARAIIDFERQAGLYLEPDAQSLAMRWEPAIRAFNWFYSFAFLTIVALAILWLWATDDRNYRLFRNSLGLSVLPALLLIALFPVAPPRLMAESGLIDSIAFFGREHAFANEYAAVPSLHVGWMALTGVVLARSIRGRWARLIAFTPGMLMMATVVVTGNHYWIDGAIGAAFALSAAAALTWNEPDSLAHGWWRGTGAAARAVGGFAAACGLTLLRNAKAQFSVISLGLLLTYMLGMQVRAPGFTDFWLYLVLQTGVFMLLLWLGEVVFARQGGLSWLTHVIAVTCTFADVLGTDGNLYNRIDEYDKLTHFLGTAAITAGLYDVLRALYFRGNIPWNANERLTLAMAAGLAAGVGWEVYELMADRVFGTGRVQGVWDTGNDLISDALGAVGVAGLLWFNEQQRFPEREQLLTQHDDAQRE